MLLIPAYAMAMEIAGTWQVRRFGQGTFRIWPGRHDETVGADESIEVPEPVEAVTVECSVLQAPLISGIQNSSPFP